MSRNSMLFDKSIAACISAIEIYNKPDFRYREETFTILMINAWELLLKAKIIKDNKNQVQSIYIREPKRLRNGMRSVKQTTVKKSRSGNPMSIELIRAMELVAQHDKSVTAPLRENITALCEIRDNAVHFRNDEPELGKLVLELGTASLKNYLNAVKIWFDKDLSRYNFYLMPMSFFHEFESMGSFSVSRNTTQLDNLMAYLSKKAAEHKSDPDQEYNLLLKVETKFVKSSIEEALIVKQVRKREEAENPEAVQEVILTEENVLEKFPWTYLELCKRLKNRFEDFKQDFRFRDLIRELKQNPMLCHTRLANPLAKKSARTYFYSPNCVQGFFDQEYSTRSSAPVVARAISIDDFKFP